MARKPRAQEEDQNWDDEEPGPAAESVTRAYVCDDCYYRWVEEEKSPAAEEEEYDEDGNLRLPDAAEERTCPVCPMCGSTTVSEC